MELEREDVGLGKHVSRYDFTSSRVVLLETVMSHTTSSSSRKEQTRVLGRAILSLFEPLRKSTDTRSDVTLKETKVWRCFQKATL